MLGDDDLELPIRKGSPSVKLTRDEFRERFRAQFFDPAFEQVTAELDAVETVAWEAYAASRKSPRTRAAGPGFARARRLHQGLGARAGADVAATARCGGRAQRGIDRVAGVGAAPLHAIIG